MFQAIGFILRYGPLVFAAVQAVENFVKPGTSGEKKKELATRFITQALKSFNVTVNPRMEEIIGQVISLAVTVLNAFGFFTSSEGEDEDAIEVASDVAVETRVASADDDPNAAEFSRLMGELNKAR